MHVLTYVVSMTNCLESLKSDSSNLSNNCDLERKPKIMKVSALSTGANITNTVIDHSYNAVVVFLYLNTNSWLFAILISVIFLSIFFGIVVLGNNYRKSFEEKWVFIYDHIHQINQPSSYIASKNTFSCNDF